MIPKAPGFQAAAVFISAFVRYGDAGERLDSRGRRGDAVKPAFRSAGISMLHQLMYFGRFFGFFLAKRTGIEAELQSACL